MPPTRPTGCAPVCEVPRSSQFPATLAGEAGAGGGLNIFGAAHPGSKMTAVMESSRSARGRGRIQHLLALGGRTLLRMQAEARRVASRVSGSRAVEARAGCSQRDAGATRKKPADFRQAFWFAVHCPLR